MAKDELKKEIDEEIGDNYFSFLSKYKPLKKAEEHKLILDYRENNNIAARNKLIQSNMQYACRLASKYIGCGISFPELVSEANSGLIEAVDRFDLSKDVKFITYSRWWIIQRIQKSIDEKKENRLNNDFLNNMDSVSNDDEQIGGFVPYDIYDEADGPDEVDKMDDYEMLCSILSCLNNREVDIIKMYYGIDYDREYNLVEIGEKHSLTKERIKDIIKEAFKKVRTEVMLNDYDLG